jgi:hypothetical protein
MWNELNSATVLCGQKIAPSSALKRCYIFCCLYVGSSLHKVHEGVDVGDCMYASCVCTFRL